MLTQRRDLSTFRVPGAVLSTDPYFIQPVTASVRRYHYSHVLDEEAQKRCVTCSASARRVTPGIDLSFLHQEVQTALYDSPFREEEEGQDSAESLALWVAASVSSQEHSAAPELLIKEEINRKLRGISQSNSGHPEYPQPVSKGRPLLHCSCK